jgi:SAM-dependent methyltransferase
MPDHTGVTARMVAAIGTRAQAPDFWTEYQPGFRFSNAEVGTRDWFAEIEAHRYRLEPHIPEIARFPLWAGRNVLEVGCGIATDGLQFARAGARYSAVDASDVAIELARRRFALEGADGHFVEASATALPFDDAQFDLVYSNGVLHHIPQTERAIAEIRRVLRPGGASLIMLYHRNSLNYRFTILILRRTLAFLLLSEHGAALARCISGEHSAVLEGHRSLLHKHGVRYLTDSALFLSNNTDGPGNPLSKVYSRDEAKRLLRCAGLDHLTTAVRYLNLRIFPGGEAIARTKAARRLERTIGWHLYVTGRKPDPAR